MTVQELIDELQKIEDKTLQVYIVDTEYGDYEVTDIYESRCQLQSDRVNIF